MKRGIKKDDVVVVIRGEHKGKSGKVLKVDRHSDRVTIEGVNVHRVTVKKTRQKPQAGIVERELPVHRAKVMLKERYDARRARRAQPAA